MAVLTTNYQKIGEKYIANTGYGTLYARIYGKYNSYNSSAGTVNVTTLFQLYLSGGSAYAYSNYVSLDGAGWSGNISINGGEENVQNLITSTFDVSTNADGSSRGYVSSASYNIYGVGDNLSVGFDTPTIPRYASITSFNANSINENTIRVTWSANANVDLVQYFINDSGWISTSGTTFDIGNLSGGVQYSLKIRVRRADSGQWTESGTIYPSTYDYPHITSNGVASPNLIIGNSQTLTLYNPLGRDVTVRMYQNTTSGLQLYSGTTNGTIITFTPDSELLYNSIPTTTNSVCVYSVIYGSFTKTTGQYTYLINANECKPIFEDFSYSTNYRELTGNNDTIINNKTTTTVTISSANKAVGKNGATISRYSVQIGNLDPSLINYSNDDVSTTISNCNSDIIRVTAIDSRNLETTISKTVTNFKNYFAPTFVSTSVEREDGIEETVFLDLKLQFWNYNFGYKRNNIISLKYRVKESSSDTYSEWFSINVGQLIINREEATLENVRIYSDGISQGFTVGTFYDLQMQVVDGNGELQLSEIISSTFGLADGKVAFSILKDNNGEYHIGINGMPDLNSTMKVYGTIVDDNS